jgi:hypothetical protein
VKKTDISSLPSMLLPRAQQMYATSSPNRAIPLPATASQPSVIHDWILVTNRLRPSRVSLEEKRRRPAVTIPESFSTARARNWYERGWGEPWPGSGSASSCGAASWGSIISATPLAIDSGSAWARLLSTTR